MRGSRPSPSRPRRPEQAGRRQRHQHARPPRNKLSARPHRRSQRAAAIIPSGLRCAGQSPTAVLTRAALARLVRARAVVVRPAARPRTCWPASSRRAPTASRGPSCSPTAPWRAEGRGLERAGRDAVLVGERVRRRTTWASRRTSSRLSSRATTTTTTSSASPTTARNFRELWVAPPGRRARAARAIDRGARRRSGALAEVVGARRRSRLLGDRAAGLDRARCRRWSRGAVVRGARGPRADGLRLPGAGVRRRAVRDAPGIAGRPGGAARGCCRRPPRRRCCRAIAAAWPLGGRELSAARAAAAAITLLALLRGWDRVRRAPPHAKTVVAACATGALLAFACFYNLGRPQFWHHGKQRPMFVHDTDMRIYQPFAKYFDELGYEGIYLASALAYAEDERGGSVDADRRDEDPRPARLPPAHGRRGPRRHAEGQAALHTRALGRRSSATSRSSGRRWARPSSPPSTITAPTRRRRGSGSRAWHRPRARHRDDADDRRA